MWNNQWKKGVDYPEWGDNEVYKKTIGGGYLYNGETPKEAYQRVSKAVAKRLFNLKWLMSFLSTYGKDGCVSLVQYYLTQVLIVVCLLAVSVLMWLIVSLT